MAVTIRDVAKKAGVCAGTVSLVVNKKPGISEATRTRVEQVLAELDYRPNVVAQRLVTRQVRTIGLLYSEHLSSGGAPSGFLLDVFEGVRSFTNAHQASIILVSVAEEFHHDRFGVRMIHREKMSGVLLVAVDQNSPYFHLVRDSEIPFVEVNRRLDDGSISYVVLDYEGAAFQGVGHLLECGYARIGALVSENRASITRDILNGYCKAQGIAEPEAALIQMNDGTREGGRRAMARLMDQGVTGVFASGDVLAYAALEEARSRRVTVPDDLGIVSIYDYSDPEGEHELLTTIQYPTSELGRTGADCLFQLLDNPGIRAHRSLIRTTLVQGSTTRGRNLGWV